MCDSSSLAPSEPWSKPSRFKEHLSFTGQYGNSALEYSHFSPDSPNPLQAEHDLQPPPLPSPPGPKSSSHDYDFHSHHRSGTSFSSLTLKAFSPPPKACDLEQGFSIPDEERSTTPRTTTTFRDRMSRRLFEFRFGMRRQTSQFDLPIQHMPPWPPLNIKKHPQPSVAQCCVHCKKRPAKEGPLKKWKKRVLVIVLIILLLWLSGNVVALNTTTFRSSTAAPMPNSSTGLSTDQISCLSQFRLNAPSNPTLYPCAQCLPLLVQVSANASSNFVDTALNAAQFCGLRSLWENADASGQAALQASGWVEDVGFCAWGGVQCNGLGQVSSIQLTTPAVPASIPSQLSNRSLPGLETFQIIGNNTSPSGPLPSSFGSFNLTTLHLESTGLEGSVQGSLSTVTTLTLVRNPNLSGVLPDTIAQGTLQTLYVSNAQQAAFCMSNTLRTCDLRGTGIASCGSCTVG
ncbi:hypothetical protein K488DRAFT_80492 [Vararia minispora EC-137]|uniref:Uncharacterized protein n=1 Tax=Vararia minispora EC-137 TaxID=1314806 RepID=A0ACB8QAJ5_9AGAM|nr:hypothetical protein K488DRAFT_80492 [Vararia minispora EC-137]